MAAAPRQPAPPPTRHARALIVLALVPIVLMAPGLFGGRALFPLHTDQLLPWSDAQTPGALAAMEAAAHPLAADTALMFRPQQRAAIERLRHGEVPLWNPHNLGGVPLLAQAVHGVLHPPNLLHWLLTDGRAYAWIAALQCFLAGLFAYLLARQLGTGALAGTLAGLSFALCGFLAVRWHWYQIQGASMWLPLVVLGVERAVAGGRAGAAACVALGVGGSFLAGFPPSSVLILYAALLWALLRLLRRRRRIAPAMTVLPALLLGVALGLPQLLPSAEYAASGESTRASADPHVVAGLAMAPASLLRLALPDVFGHPRELARHEFPYLREKGTLSRLMQRPNANHVETAGWFGLVALVLAPLGLARRGRGRVPAAALLLGGTLLALHTPLLPYVLALPGLDTADPRRFLLLGGFGGAVLGALGLQRVLEHGPPAWYRNLLVLALFGAVAGASALSLVDDDAWIDWAAPRLAATAGVDEAEFRTRGPELVLDLSLVQMSAWRATVVLAATVIGVLAAEKRRRLGANLLILVAALDLGATSASNAAWVAPIGLDDPPPGAAALGGQGRGRLIRFHPGLPDPLAYPLPPDTGLPFGVRDASGYITLGSRRYERLHEMLQPGSTFGVGTAALSDASALASSLLDRMAVDRVLSTVPLAAPGLVMQSRIGSAWLYLRAGAAPRVRIVPMASAVLVGDADAAEAALADASGSPAGHALRSPPPVVEHAPHTGCLLAAPGDGAAAEAADAGGPDPGGPDGAAAVLVRDDPEHLVIEARAGSAPAWLVVADGWSPGWTAEVDGVRHPIFPADLAFRAVEVPPGDHRVELRYDSRGWRWGLRAGLLALAAVAILALRAGVRRLRRG